MWLHNYLKYGLVLAAITVFLLAPAPWDRPHPPSLVVTEPVEASNAEQGAGTLSQLPVGKSESHDLPSAAAHSYQVTLGVDQYLQILIEARGIDARVTLSGPGNHVVLQVDCRRDGPTPISFVSDTAGTYRLEVRAVDDQRKNGRYDLRVETIRSTAAKDKSRVSAERLTAEAEKLSREGKAESNRLGVTRFEEALPFWRAAGDGREEIRTMGRIGDLQQPLGEYQAALTEYREALSLSRKNSDRRSEGEMLSKVGYVNLILGETQKALELCTQGLRLSRQENDLRRVAQSLSNLGEVHYGLGHLQQSLDFYLQAIQLWRDLEDREGEASVLLNFGYTYSDLGQMREALTSFEQALGLWQAAGNRRGQALALSATGRMYSRTGQIQNALDFFSRAMALIHVVGDPIEEARTLNGIAYLHHGLGEDQKALELYAQSLPLFRSARYASGEASTLGDMGRIYYSLRDSEKALEYHQKAQAIFKTIADDRMEMVELKEIGRVLDTLGNKTRALEAYRVARAFYHSQKDLRGEATTLGLMGHIYEQRQQAPRALETYRAALALSQQAEDRFGEAAALYDIASLERDRGNFSAALDRTETALAMIESLRAKVVSQNLRSSYFATVRRHYELYVDVLMQLHKQHPDGGFEARAFEISERARARSLLESLKEARAEIREGVDPALLERERALEQALNAKAEQRSQLLGEKKNDQAAAVAAEIGRLTTEYDEVEAQIKLMSPRYAALTQPQPLSLRETQAQVLDDDSILLEYELGDARSYMWAVSRNGVSSFELPGRAQIERVALQFYELLKARQPLPGETSEQRQSRADEADAQLPAAATSLSRLVLDPVAAELGHRRLLIVPDGALQYVPFQALTVAGTTTRDGETRTAVEGPSSGDSRVPLMVDHEIVNEPSASALALVLNDTAKRARAADSVAVLANPVFESDDPRVKAKAASEGEMTRAAPIKEVLRDVGFGDGSHLPPLPASRDEANAIMAVVPSCSGIKAEGFDASRMTISRPDFRQYRIVHFATHGFVDYEHPELSGLVLSLVDQQGRPQDGFLRLHDIYNLKLSADMVVLSACNTGLGKDVKGEGLIGLTRGFMYAGAAGVTASLWKVDDEATAELMTHFYRGMFRDGLTPAAALRQGQLAMWRQKRWRSPYYWAAFVIQGQYNLKEDSGMGMTRCVKSMTTFGSVGVGVVVALGIFFILQRRRRKIL